MKIGIVLLDSVSHPFDEGTYFLGLRFPRSLVYPLGLNKNHARCRSVEIRRIYSVIIAAIPYRSGSFLLSAAGLKEYRQRGEAAAKDFGISLCILGPNIAKIEVGFEHRSKFHADLIYLKRRHRYTPASVDIFLMSLFSAIRYSE